LVESPIRFGTQRFDLVLAQGLFEYLGNAQDPKLAEVAEILRPNGAFVVSYTNFGHRRVELHPRFSNIRPAGEFRRSLERHFIVERQVPTSHNWSHGQPMRRFNKA